MYEDTQKAHAEKAVKFFEGQERVEQMHNLARFEIEIAHHSGSVVEVDLSATNPTYFIAQIARQAYDQGLAKGRRQKVEEFRAVLAFDGEEGE